MKNPPPTGNILQYLRLSSNPNDPHFDARLALAVHRPSTTLGFISSMEGAIMAEADAWIALVAWTRREDAERATEEWFHSDYHAEFAKNVTEIEANEIFTVPYGIFGDMYDSRYARFLWIEHFDAEDSELWQRYVAWRISDLNSRQAFVDAFSFDGLAGSGQRGLVSSWDDPVPLRQTHESIEEQNASTPGIESRSEFLRITSSNTAAD